MNCTLKERGRGAACGDEVSELFLESGLSDWSLSVFLRRLTDYYMNWFSSVSRNLRSDQNSFSPVEPNLWSQVNSSRWNVPPVPRALGPADVQLKERSCPLQVFHPNPQVPSWTLLQLQQRRRRFHRHTMEASRWSSFNTPEHRLRPESAGWFILVDVGTL